MGHPCDGGFERVFELGTDTMIHPLTNRWNVQPPIPANVGTANPSFLYVERRGEIVPGEMLLLTDASDPNQNQAAIVSNVENVASNDSRRIVLAS